MRFIKISDEECNKIWSTYSTYDYTIYFDGQYPHVGIPLQLVTDDEVILKKHVYEYSEDAVWLKAFNVDKRIEAISGLTAKQYFDFIAYHIVDDSILPKCKSCGKPLTEFTNYIYGYNLNKHNRYLIEKIELCRDCYNEYVTELFKHMWDDENANPEHALRLSKNRSNPIFNAVNQRSIFINKGDPNEPCEYYYGKLVDGRLKFGVTSDLDSRLHTHATYYENPFSEIYQDIGLMRKQVANLECYVSSFSSLFNYFEDTESNRLLYDKAFNIAFKLIDEDLDYKQLTEMTNQLNLTSTTIEKM